MREPGLHRRSLRTVVRPVLHFPYVAERSIQIGPKVLDALDTYAQPQQRRRQVLLPGNVGPPFDGGLDRAQAGGVLDEPQSGAPASAAGASPRTSNEIIVPKPLSWRRAASCVGWLARPG